MPNKCRLKGCRLNLVRHHSRPSEMPEETTIDDLAIAIVNGRGLAEFLPFIASGGTVNDRLADSGLTLLHLAVESGNLPMIRLLVDEGADIDAEDSNGWTPLHHAVDFDIDSAGQTSWEEGAFFRNLTFETTGLLVCLGATLNLQLKTGETPRDLAKAYGNQVIEHFDAIVANALQGV